MMQSSASGVEQPLKWSPLEKEESFSDGHKQSMKEMAVKSIKPCFAAAL